MKTKRIINLATAAMMLLVTIVGTGCSSNSDSPVYPSNELTDAEKAELLEKYESEPDKMEILNSTKYGYVADTKEFNELRENHFDLSVDEVTAKANEILLSYAETGSLKFSTDEEHKDNFRQIPYVKPEKKTGRYGNLFSR